MKYLAALLSVGLLFLLILLVGAFSLFPSSEATQPAVVISIDRDIAPLKATLAVQEADYLAQLGQLDTDLQQQQIEAQSRLEMLTAQIEAAQAQLDALQAQKQQIQTDIARLEAIKHERQASYQIQLQQLGDQHAERMAGLQTQLEAVQSELGQIALQ